MHEIVRTNVTLVTEVIRNYCWSLHAGDVVILQLVARVLEGTLKDMPRSYPSLFRHRSSQVQSPLSQLAIPHYKSAISPLIPSHPPLNARVLRHFHLPICWFTPLIMLVVKPRSTSSKKHPRSLKRAR